MHGRAVGNKYGLARFGVMLAGPFFGWCTCVGRSFLDSMLSILSYVVRIFYGHIIIVAA